MLYAGISFKITAISSSKLSLAGSFSKKLILFTVWCENRWNIFYLIFNYIMESGKTSAISVSAVGCQLKLTWLYFIWIKASWKEPEFYVEFYSDQSLQCTFYLSCWLGQEYSSVPWFLVFQEYFRRSISGDNMADFAENRTFSDLTLSLCLTLV